MDNEPPPFAADTPPAASRRRALRASDVAAGAAVGGLLTLAAIIAAVAVYRRQATPPLTIETLTAAQERWRENGPVDYRMEVAVHGRRSGRYRAEVRGGKPTEVLQDDRKLARRSWPYWTVPGLLEVVEHDIACADDPTRGFGAQPGSQAVLRAEFDAATGYPRKFERLILGEPQLDMTWEVTRFVSESLK